MTDKPATPCRITIAAYRTRAEGGTQIQIAELGATGTGWGRRLAGPKHYNLGTTTLVERVLDADDAREIRSMLDKVFRPAPLLSAPQRVFLLHALALAANAMAITPDQYGDDDEAALEWLRALAAAPATEPEGADPWQGLADALNAAGALGIDLDGTITDHDEHSVVWDRDAARWVVAAYDEDEAAAPATEDGAKPIARYRDASGTVWEHTGDREADGSPLYSEAGLTPARRNDSVLHGMTVGEIEYGVGRLTPVVGAAPATEDGAR